MYYLPLLLLAATPTAPADPGSDVLRVFQARCSSCHSPQAKEIQGDFGYVLDLKRLAADPDKVIPGKPEASDLWKLASSGNMPPNDSPTGPLNDAQRTAIKTWIAAGAPLPKPPPEPVTEPSPPPPDNPPAPKADTAPVAPAQPDALDASEPAPPARESLGQHLGRWSGESHLLLLHFPIVCLLAAGVAEARGWWRGQVSASATASFCIWVAALSAVPTVAAGWIHAANGHGLAHPDTLGWHRWLGTSAGGLALLTALVHSHAGKVLTPKQHSRARRAVLALAAGLVVWAAHMGGKLAFGANFLGW